MLTAYQLIDRRFGHTLHKITAGLFLLTRAAAEGVRVFAISIVVSIAIGTGDVLSIAIISALTLLYTFEGGMAAVIWTDVVQMALYVAGTLVALITLGAHVPGGWAHIHAVAAPLGKFHWLDFTLNLTTTYTFWAGVLGGTFLTMASHGTDQLMVQRLLAARNLRESRLALLSSGAVIFLQFTLFLLIGVGLFVFYGAAGAPHFRSNDYIFPTYIVQQMPHGIAGLLVAAILAAAMSNLSAALNSLASTTVIDFWLPWRGARNTTLISRASTVFWAIVLFAIAVYSIRHGGKGHVVETGLSIASVAYGCLLGVFLLGTLTRYATQTGAILGMICGFALNLFLWQGDFPMQLAGLTIPHVAFTWYVIIGSVATFAVGSLFSLILPKPRRTFAAILIFALSFPKGICVSSAEAQPQAQPTTNTAYDFTSVSTLIDAAIAEHKLPGAVVLIGHNEKVVFEKAYGLRKLPGEPGLDGKPSAAEPMTLDTIFDMASLTKVIVTTTTTLQLYEQGKLDLDAPVSKYLPEFASTTGDPTTISAGTPNPVTPPTAVIPAEGRNLRGSLDAAKSWKSQITIRQLLTHYSGLPEDVSLKDDWGLKSPDKAEGIRRAMASIPYGLPGVTFKYSDINFITLGLLVEKVSGQQLDDYARAHVFEPLGMMSTRYHPFDKTCGPVVRDGAAIQPGPKPVGRIGVVCLPPTWSPLATIPSTAPTAHDNEGTALTNPDYDHLLRGTVHDPTTRRMGGVAGHAGLFSTAEDMSKFCQALLDKLLHNTGSFPLKQSTLQLATSPQAPATAVATATIFTPDGQTTKGVAQRGLGWDINSPYSRPRGEIFPITTKEHPGSFGHTGFTGTSLWLDPTSNTYVILLANAIHPRGNPPISTLRGAVATAAAKALGLSSPSSLPPSPALLSFRSEAEESAFPATPASTFPPKNAVILSAANAASGVNKSGPSPTFSTRPDPRSSPAQAPSSAPHLRDGLIVTKVGIGEADPSTSAHPSTNLQATRLVAFQIQNPATGPGTKSPAYPPTLTGIDVLEQTHFAALKSLAKARPIRIALLTNQSGLDSHGNRTIDILLHADPQIRLVKLFTPEHGLSAKQDTENLKTETDATTQLPVISLYGAKPADRHPKPEDLKDLDAVVIDLQDMGVRFWTYEAVLGYFLEANQCGGPDLFVLDRPDPIGGLAVQGNLSETRNYNAYMPLPIRHGLTYGELAQYFEGQMPPACDMDPRPPGEKRLTVIPMQNWHRAEFFSDTHLPFTPPSPNMKTLAATILYPGVGLIDQTNISVGRGTGTPYENIGAPYIDAKELAAYLTARHIPGITFAPTTLAIAETIEKYPGHGQTIPAIHFTVTDRTALDTPELGIELISALHHLYPTQFQLEKVATLLANPETLAALESGTDPRDIAASWTASLAAFRAAAAPYLMYH